MEHILTMANLKLKHSLFTHRPTLHGNDSHAVDLMTSAFVYYCQPKWFKIIILFIIIIYTESLYVPRAKKVKIQIPVRHKIMRYDHDDHNHGR